MPTPLTYNSGYLHARPAPTFSSLDAGNKSFERLVEGDPVEQTINGKIITNTLAEDWKPGALRRFPWLAFSSLIGSAGCAIGGVVVLVSSDGKSTAEWDENLHLRPAVYLAILSVLANVFLVFALAKGMVVTFWRAALEGCTLADLHYIWDSGTSFLGAIQGIIRKKAFLIAIATILTVISVARGPLNQRATTVQSNHQVALNGTSLFNIAQRLPDELGGYARTTRAAARDTARLTPNLTNVLLEYSRRTPMSIHHSTCGVQCDAIVKGFGFNINCSEAINYVEMAPLGGEVEFFAAWASLSFTEGPGQSNVGLPSWITINAKYHDATAPNTNSSLFPIRQHTCDLHGGITSYRLNVTGQAISFSSPDRTTDTFIQEVELLGPINYGGSPTVIGGFQYAFDTLFNSSASYYQGGAVASTTLKGNLANQYVVENATAGEFFSFMDPMEEMLTAARELSLRASIAAANIAWSRADGNETALSLARDTYQQNVTFTGIYLDDIYVTDRDFLAVSALISFLSIVAVTATFWGYWNLGRNVSFSPLEIAKAFDADVLRHLGDNVESITLAKNARGDFVRYRKEGRLKDEEGARLRIVRS